MKCTRLTSQARLLIPRGLAHVVRKARSWLNTSIVLLVVVVDILSSNEKVTRSYSPTIAITHLTKMRTPITIVSTISTRNTPGI
jgi:hypothetical protein